MDRPDIEVGVIGAGPYGLSVASYLRARRKETVVIGDLMSTWRSHMPSGMYLKSTPRASSIASPGHSHSFTCYRALLGREPVQDDYPIPIQEFISYGEWFSDELVPAVSDSVQTLHRERDRFICTFASGETLSTKVVVLASGTIDHAYLPTVFSCLQTKCDNVRHSSEVTDLESLSGHEVAIIGAGQSALETATLASELGARVHLLVRGKEVLFGDPPGSYSLKPRSLLGPGWSLFAMDRFPNLVRLLPAEQRSYVLRTVLGPSGAWWLRPRFNNIDVRLGVTVRSAQPKGTDITLKLSNGDEIVVSHVIAATGYRPNLHKIRYLSEELRSELTANDPFRSRLSPNFESRVPGLFITGLNAAPTFGPLLRFVAGTEFSSRRIERGVTESLARIT